jgi:hypothetical protein
MKTHIVGKIFISKCVSIKPNGKIKTGIHLTCLDRAMIVDVDYAYNVRLQCIDRLHKFYGDKINWNDVIDVFPYMQKCGQRMLFSSKPVNGQNIGHIYEYVGILDNDGIITVGNYSNLELVKLSSIHIV